MIPPLRPRFPTAARPYSHALSAQRTYIRASIAAQSQLSVPPAPELISRNVSLPSASPSRSASTSLAAAFRRVSSAPPRPRPPLRRRLPSRPARSARRCRPCPAPWPVGVHRINQHLAFAHQLLRACRIVPEIRILGHGVELFKPVRRGFPIHSLAQTAPATSRSPRRMIGLPRAWDASLGKSGSDQGDTGPPGRGQDQ